MTKDRPMKLKQNARIFTLVALGAASVFLGNSGAVAADYKLADKVGKGIAECRDEIIDVKKAVDGTLAALDKIVATAATDPRKAFKEFNKSVPKIDSAAAKARKRAEEMQARGKEYFTTWEKGLSDVNDPQIRKLAEERKAKLQATFDSIKANLAPAKEQFNTWLTHCKDVQKYLSQDLSIEGIEAAKDLLAKSKQDGVAVQASLDKVITDLNTVVATITPSKGSAK